MKIFVQKGADINARDDDDWTPLHTAALNCKFLNKSFHFQVFIFFSLIKTYLFFHYQIFFLLLNLLDHEGVVNFLLEKGAHPNGVHNVGNASLSSGNIRNNENCKFCVLLTFIINLLILVYQ